MPEPATPSDEKLDELIRARLALAGVDLDQLGESPDPETGSPSRAQALESLRGFLAGPRSGGVRTGGTVRTINRWQPPVDETPGSDADRDRLAQQEAPPLLYPSITTAWTAEERR